MKGHIYKYYVLLMSVLLPLAAAGYDFEQDGIYYTVGGDSATVTAGDSPYSGFVTIPEAVTHDGCTYPVTAIGGASFRDCKALTGITIPATVATISDYAFLRCTSLQEVHISDLAAWCETSFLDETSNPCYYAHHLYLNDKEITTLTIPDSVTTVGQFSFIGCSSLDSVHIPASVTAIGPKSFADCSGIAAITVAGDNPVYDSRDSCNAIIATANGVLVVGCRNTIIPGTVTAIFDYAFYGCSGLTGINLPSSVTAIGVEAFCRCTGLMGVAFSSNTRVIGFQAFNGCTSLHAVTIPRSVRAIGFSAFGDCPSIMSMTVASGNRTYDSRDDCNAIIETADNVLVAGCMNTVIPGTVNVIDDYAFYGCSKLTEALMPESVTAIGDYAFTGCSALRHVSFPDSLRVIGSSAFKGCSLLSRVDLPDSLTSIGAFAFELCPAITSITVSGGNPVYDSRDSCNALIETASNMLIAGCMNSTIPGTVKAIGDNAFNGCFMLRSMDIPKSVTAIGAYAFAGCTSLNSVTIPHSVTAIGDAAFNSCSALTNLDIPNSVKFIGDGPFVGCSSLISVSLPNTVTAITDYEFYGCTMLSRVNIPKSVTSIGNAAFYACASLNDIRIPTSVTTIGSSAFHGCSSLTAITIPSAVTAIGSSAFRYCPALTTITVARGNTVYDSRDGCNAIIETATDRLITGCQSTTIPATVKAIGMNAFADCISLAGITIPASVRAIGLKAFYGCTALHDIYMQVDDPQLVTVGKSAFDLETEDYTGRTLHVPAGSAAAYQQSSPWQSRFEIICEQ